MALGVADYVWSIDDLVNSATTEAPTTDLWRFGRFTAIERGRYAAREPYWLRRG
jgi:hypothetical protein